VAVNRLPRGTFAPNRRLIVRGMEGHDRIETAGSVTQNVWLYGGPGNDHLKGGAGHDVLLGEEGDDL
jgi:Ca2+-binding RTX toxin-like protein